MRIQPRAGVRGGSGGQPRPGLHRVRGSAIHLRADRRTCPPIRPRAAPWGFGAHRERSELAPYESGQSHLGLVHGELQRVPRGHARRVQGTGGPVQRQLSLCRRRTGVSARQCPRGRGHVPRAVRPDAGRGVGTSRSCPDAADPRRRRVRATIRCPARCATRSCWPRCPTSRSTSRCRRTISMCSTPVAPPGCPRRCCGASTTST